MSEAQDETVPQPPAMPAACDALRSLRVSRGFSCLFWAMPVLAGAHAAAMVSALPVRWTIGMLAVSFLPLLCGIWRLRSAGELTSRWSRRMAQSSMLALVTVYLSPFLAWWTAAPTRGFFAVNAAAHYVALVLMLASLSRLAGESARWMGDTGLRREAHAGMGMILWLSGCTLVALAWLFHRAGVLDAGLPTVSSQLARLPREARTLFLLPYAMTAYVTWRAKETGFKRAFGPAE